MFFKFSNWGFIGPKQTTITHNDSLILVIPNTTYVTSYDQRHQGQKRKLNSGFRKMSNDDFTHTEFSVT